MPHAAAVAVTPDPQPNEDGAFALLADTAPALMWVTRADGSRAFVNRAYRDFAGLDGGEALAGHWRERVHPDDSARVAAETEAGIAAQRTFGLDARYRSAAGEWRWLRSVSRPRFDTAGALTGYIGVALDVTEAKTAELELREREHQLSALVDQTTAGLAQVDLQGRFTTVNDRFCELVGRSRDQLLGLSAREITHPGDLQRNDELFRYAIDGGSAFSADKRYLRPDGSAVWVNNSVTTIRDATGTPTRFNAIVLDITARRAAEEALRHNEARLRFLDALGKATATASDADAVLAITTRLLGEHLDASDCAYADVEADGDTFHIRGDWNAPGAPSIVGSYSLATFGSQAVADMHAGRPLIITDIAAIEGDGAAAFRAIGIAATICMPFIKGNRFAAMMAVHSMTPRDWTDAELALVREVTERSWAHVERVRAEAAMRDSESQLRLAVEGARIGTWETDFRTGRGRWSPRAAAIMGVPHDEPLSERRRMELVHPDDRQRLREGSARLARSGNDFAVEHRIIRPDGALRWVASHGIVLRDEAGVPLRAIGTIRDVTERREAQEALAALNRTLESQVAERAAELSAAQEALRQAQKVESLGQLTGGVAHDFNNLLTPIIGNLDLLSRRVAKEDGGDEKQARLIGAALESAERARLLVQRLLAFARRQPLQPGPVDLAGLLGDMATLVASTVGPQVELTTDVAPDLPPALADPNQLELAVLNLAVNARDAMPDGGLLRLGAGRADARAVATAGLTGDFLSLSVADTGTGMDADVAARAVEPFFSTKGVGKGTGLGLSMVHGLASQLGGAMTLTTAPGEGTRVELLLPLATGDAIVPPAPAPPPAALTGRVLLVDDEPPVRDATAAMLSSLGLRVTAAGSGDEALAMLGGADYLVTDHLMPGIKGADLARVARQRAPGLKVLVVSGYAALDEIPPDVPRLAKPFRVEELAAALGALR